MATDTRTIEHAAATVGDALRNVGYSEAGVVDLLGEDAYSVGAEDVPVNERMLPETKLATVVRASTPIPSHPIAAGERRARATPRRSV